MTEILASTAQLERRIKELAMQFDATETVAAALDEGSRRQTLLQGVKKSREALERGERELLKEADALPVLRDSYVKGISLESGVRRR